MRKVTVAGCIMVMVFLLIVASMLWLQKKVDRDIFDPHSVEVDD